MGSSVKQQVVHRFETKPRLLTTSPAEVLLIICKRSSRRELKFLRRTCKAVAKMVEPLLFEEVVVVPCQESFQNAIALTRQPVLGTMVQWLT